MFMLMRGLYAHRAEKRQEMKERCRGLLPEAFWEHARASRREAKLACQAFRRAMKHQFIRPEAKKPVGKQEVEIA
jgi:hypothetical protein